MKRRAWRDTVGPGAAALVGLTLAVPLAACTRPAEESLPEQRPNGYVEQEPDEAATRGMTGAAGALARSCTNGTYGFDVDFPEDWVVNGGNGLPPCTLFDPQDVSVPVDSELPTGIAIVIARDEADFRNVTAFASDPSVDVVSSRETRVDGRRAITAELRHTGWGLYDAGHLTYAWYVDLDPHTLSGVTHGGAEADPPPYAERRRILDAMMAGLRLHAAR